MSNASTFPAVTNGSFNGVNVQTVNARDLHDFLAVGKKFADWIKERIEQYAFNDGVDFLTYSQNGEKGRPIIEYAISLDMAKELRISTRWMLPLFAVTLTLSGCSKRERAFAVDGSGFSKLTPAPATSAYIVNNDLPFARQVLAHNRTCEAQPGCTD